MYQVDFQDFSEFGVGAYLSSPDQYILKNIHLRLWVAMVTKQIDVEFSPWMAKNAVKIHTWGQILLFLGRIIVSDVIFCCFIVFSINFLEKNYILQFSGP